VTIRASSPAGAGVHEPEDQVIRNTIVPEIVGNTKGVTHAVLRTPERGALQFDVGGVFTSRIPSPIRTRRRPRGPRRGGY